MSLARGSAGASEPAESERVPDAIGEANPHTLGTGGEIVLPQVAGRHAVNPPEAQPRKQPGRIAEPCRLPVSRRRKSPEFKLWLSHWLSLYRTGGGYEQLVTGAADCLACAEELVAVNDLRFSLVVPIYGGGAGFNLTCGAVFALQKP